MFHSKVRGSNKVPESQHFQAMSQLELWDLRQVPSIHLLLYIPTPFYMPRRPQRGGANAPPPLPNRDHLERANFALQASVFLQQLGLSTASTSTAVEASTSDSDSRSHSHAALDPSFPPPCLDSRSDKGKGKARAVEAEPVRTPKADFARLARHEMRAFRKWTVHNLVKL